MRILFVLACSALLISVSAFSQTNVTACGTYSGNLRLAANISSSGNCIIINGSNTTFDGCAQYSGSTCTQKFSVTSTGGDAIEIRDWTTDVVVKNVATSGGVQIDGVAAYDCTNPRLVKRVMLDSIDSSSGGIDVIQGCDITIQNSVVQGSLGISNAYAVNGPYTVRNNTFNHDVGNNSSAVNLFNVKDLTFDNNHITGPFVLSSNWGDNLNARITNNTLVANWGQCDTLDVFRIWHIKNGLVDHNNIESRAQNMPCNGSSTAYAPAVVAKFYNNYFTTISNNRFYSANVVATYGVIELRSANHDLTFYKNQIIDTVPGSSGTMAHFSNVCCNTSMDFIPLDQNHCVGAGHAPESGTYCCDPNDPNYKSPYDQPCHQRNNVWDSNLIVGGAAGVWHYGDSKDNTYRNNVIIGSTGVEAGTCEAGSGSVHYYNNTIHGTVSAVKGTSSCALDATNNIFYSGGSSSWISGPGLSGNYNLFWPAYNSGQPNSVVSAAPTFVNSTASDPTLRDYRLTNSTSNPAVNRAAPGTSSAPISVAVDRAGAPRPDSSGQFDIGAYEYNSAAPACTPFWSCGDWSACVNSNHTRVCIDLNNCGTTSGMPTTTGSCTSNSTPTPSASPTVSPSATVTPTPSNMISCGTNCAGCVTNRIVGPSCTTASRQCDGTNSIENISLSSVTLAPGAALTVSIAYSCYSTSDDNLALWYYNGSAWRLINNWPRGALTGCNNSPGTDGTLSFTFNVDSAIGTHYVRAIEAANTVLANSSSCPNITWGNVDDMSFNVATDTTAPAAPSQLLVN